MAKRLMALLGMLAMMMTTALPMAFAQETPQYGGGEVSATGVLIDELPADVATNGTHSITDEATGTLYALRSAGADLASNEGQRVTVYGTLTPGQGPAPGEEFGGSLPSIDVTRVESADELEPGARIVTATGVLGEPYTPSPDPTPVYDLTDEATGNTYQLFDISAGLDAFVGQRVTVEGTRSPGINPLNLDVTSVVPAGGSVEGEEIAVSFELLVGGEVPEGTQFFGAASQQTVALENPDGDDVYEGTLALPEGFYDLGAFEVPVSIQEGAPEDPERVIEDFGEVVLEDGHLFSASVSYDGGTEPPAPTDPEEPTDECLALNPNPQECEGYVAPGGSGSGSGSGGGTAVVSGDTTNANKGDGNAVVSAPVVDVDGDGSMDASNGEEAARVSDSAETSAANVLPATGGILPVAAAVGALLIAGALVARRLFR